MNLGNNITHSFRWLRRLYQCRHARLQITFIRKSRVQYIGIFSQSIYLQFVRHCLNQIKSTNPGPVAVSDCALYFLFVQRLITFHNHISILVTRARFTKELATSNFQGRYRTYAKIIESNRAANMKNSTEQNENTEKRPNVMSLRCGIRGIENSQCFTNKSAQTKDNILPQNAGVFRRAFKLYTIQLQGLFLRKHSCTYTCCISSFYTKTISRGGFYYTQGQSACIEDDLNLSLDLHN